VVGEETNRWGQGKRKGVMDECCRSTLYIYMKIKKPTKNLKRRGEKERMLKKSNIYGVNLIKMCYMHVVNITMKCTINLC
jgi:hypothetical protein